MSGRRTGLLLCLTSLAAAPAEPPAVAPAPPAGPRERLALTDPDRPAFVPAFAKIDNPPAGRYAERLYAYRYTLPGPYLYGYGGYGRFGWAFGHSGMGGFGPAPFTAR